MGIFKLANLILVGVALIFMSACGVGSSINPMTIAYADVEKSSYSGIENARNVVINDSGAWAMLWAEHKSTTSPQPPAPQIDFSSKTVIAVFLGTRPDGCYGVRIDNIQNIDGRMVVRYSETGKPPRDSNIVCTASLVQPTHIVAVPKSSGPFEFQKLD